MNAPKFIAPEYNSTAFNCPYCGVLTTQYWSEDPSFEWNNPYDGLVDTPTFFKIKLSWCMHCDEECLWLNGKLIVPDSGDAPLPNEDLSDNIKADYMEAASVLQKSPRAAAALLRLALQKLCEQLGGKGENVQQDINLLVKKGLDSSVIEAMNVVRIVGNNAVHPGELDVRDNPEIAAGLFDLINFIAETMLTGPKKRKAFHAKVLALDSKNRNNPGKGE